MAIIDCGIISESFRKITTRASAKLKVVGASHNLEPNASELVLKMEKIIELMVIRFRDMNPNAHYYFIKRRIEKIGLIHLDSMNEVQRNLLLEIQKILK